MTQDELKVILDKHAKWLRNEVGTSVRQESTFSSRGKKPLTIEV